MNGEGTGKRARRRGLSAEDRTLWEGVTRSVKPLRRGAKTGEEPTAQAEPAKAEASFPPRESSPIPPALKPAPKFGLKLGPKPAREIPAPPPLAPLGRRQRKRVARGNTEIDARIDLHGMTQDRAHRALLSFLRAAQGNEARLVLVITGKGARGDGTERERGVLKRMVPQWLALPECRPLVVGFEAAHIAHGGEGALYVRVRRG